VKVSPVKYRKNGGLTYETIGNLNHEGGSQKIKGKAAKCPRKAHFISLAHETDYVGVSEVKSI
jgi:hypothetical protein